mmetsp:Transcript_22856/g.64244  ORF Transcript_22856/g.64244 Transcript_22856/m.64244 type:complete len:200 (+) Transcript_22856:49-648(+)
MVASSSAAWAPSSRIFSARAFLRSHSGSSSGVFSGRNSCFTSPLARRAPSSPMSITGASILKEMRSRICTGSPRPSASGMVTSSGSSLRGAGGSTMGSAAFCFPRASPASFRLMLTGAAPACSGASCSSHLRGPGWAAAPSSSPSFCSTTPCHLEPLEVAKFTGARGCSRRCNAASAVSPAIAWRLIPSRCRCCFSCPC